METKFLSDGRKVAVIGQLNNVESIVQEIFVTEGGDEIPSGERFTTKSLHDEPVKSYLEKQTESSKRQAEQCKLEIETLNKKKRAMQIEIRNYAGMLKCNEKLLATVEASEIDRLSDFLTGNIKYLVALDWYYKEPQLFSETIGKEGEFDRDNIRLMSVFGKSNGDLEYKINRYSDGSGGDTTVVPASTYEEALDAIKEHALEDHSKGYLSADKFAKCVNMGIEFSDDIKAEMFEKLESTYLKNCEHAEDAKAKTMERVNKEYESSKKAFE